MIIVNKNEGTKIPYEVNGAKITFDDELMLNLEKLQKDFAVHKDICFDWQGDLVIGAESGRYYVAEIDIPAIEYEEVVSEDEEETSAMIPLELDMEKVVLTLWSIDNKKKVEV